MKAKRPRWVADTGTPDGKVVAFEILGSPDRYFRGVERRETPYIDLYSPGNQVVLQEPTADGLVFRLIKIDPAAYK